MGKYLEAILQRKGRMAHSETHYIKKLSWITEGKFTEDL